MPSAVEANGHHADKLDFTTFHNVIGGKLTKTSETRHSFNPATGNPNAEVPLSTQGDLDNAVAAARQAFKTWSKTTFEERREKLHAYAEALETYREDFVNLVISEQGKAYGLAQDEFNRTMKMIRTTPNLKLEEEVVEDSEKYTATVRYVPLGVTCGLVPWNYPLLLAWGKIAAAVYTGNTIIVKPSPDTPYCGLKLVELTMQFFPPGVIQALSGGHNLGPMCTAHPDIDKISFTGSIAVGKKVMEGCSKTLKRCTLELGGNDAAIVCEDVDFDKVVPPIAQLCFINSGQICMAIKRVYIHSSIYPRFRDALVAYSQNLKLGPGHDKDNYVGPVQNTVQHEKVLSYFDDIENDHLNTVMGGRNPDDKTGKGYFITPTLIDNPPHSSRIVQEEPFGPIVPLLQWSDEEEVIEKANNSRFGLGASVWSSDLKRGEHMARRLEAGSVWVNMHFEVQPNVPYGGHKWSGMGTEWGVAGLKQWCNGQSVWVPKA